MIGSHNTFSYLPTTKWWMKLLTPWHKCQQWKAYYQVHAANAGYLDIRIRFDKNNEPVLVHNNVIYKTPYKGVFDYISNQFTACNLVEPIPYRLMLDVRKCPKDYLKQEKLFRDLVDKMQQLPYNHKNIKIDEARIYWDWQHPLIKSKYNIQEIHTSVCSPWYKYILGTKWFAKRHNKAALVNDKMFADKTIVYLIDYVNLGR